MQQSHSSVSYLNDTSEMGQLLRSAMKTATLNVGALSYTKRCNDNFSRFIHLSC
ncbi:hypothetical protein [Wolbachia pipientis]